MKSERSVQRKLEWTLLWIIPRTDGRSVPLLSPEIMIGLMEQKEVMRITGGKGVDVVFDPVKLGS
jgi:hypothetical protein